MQRERGPSCLLWRQNRRAKPLEPGRKPLIQGLETAFFQIRLSPEMQDFNPKVTGSIPVPPRWLVTGIHFASDNCLLNDMVMRNSRICCNEMAANNAEGCAHLGPRRGDERDPP
jgi:hypothetical protein